MRYTDIPVVAREYLIYLETIKGRSSKTVSEYYVDLRSFFRFYLLKQNLVSSDTPFAKIDTSVISLEQIRSITLIDLYEFMHYLLDDRQNKSAARARKTSAIRGFFSYLTVQRHLLDENPAQNLELPTIKKALPKYLTLEQCRQLLSAIDGTFRERDYCIIILFLNCGMRISELVGINYADLHKDQITITGKGNKQRMIYLNTACLDALEVYQNDLSANPNKYHRKPGEKALFLNKNGSRISPRGVEMMLEKYLKAAGLSDLGISPHKLRHTAATLMYQYGNVDIRILQEILGHENLGTTEIYTHVSNRQVAEAVNRNPLANETSQPIKES